MRDTKDDVQLKAVAKEYYDATRDGELSVARKIFNVMADEASIEEFKQWRRYCYHYHKGYKAWQR
jgi:hypothetical protein